MSSAAQDIDQIIREQLPATGFVVNGGRDYYMEVKDNDTGLVWMGATPATAEQFAALTLTPSLSKVGIGLASMDRAAFRYSPGADDAPVRQRIIDGYLFINVASPGAMTPPTVAGGPIKISVDKAHTIAFAAGRIVTIMSLPEGDFVELVGDSSDDASRVLPPGAALRTIELQQAWRVALPTPTCTFFWWGDSMRSFQGPVTLPRGY